MKKIILVDNDELMQISMKMNFQAHKNLELVFFKNGSDALSYLEKNKVDLFISDYNLGDSKGTLLIQAAKKIYPKMCTAILTAENEDNISKSSKLVGANAVISKMQSPKTLMTAILKLLEVRNG